MGDMTTDFITVTARAAELEAENKRLEARVTELITRRTELQTANTHYLERSREFKAKWDDAEQAILVLEEDREYWINHSKDWAAMFANLRQDVEKYERDMRSWVKGVQELYRTGFVMDFILAAMFFAVMVGFIEPVANWRWW